MGERVFPYEKKGQVSEDGRISLVAPVSFFPVEVLDGSFALSLHLNSGRVCVDAFWPWITFRRLNFPHYGLFVQDSYAPLWKGATSGGYRE